MKNTLANFIRGLLVFVIAASAVMCKFWLPGAIFAVINHLDAFYGGMIGARESVTVCALSAAVILPVFVIFVMSFAFPRAIENDTLFSEKTSKLLKVIGIILNCDCVFFCILLMGLLLIWKVSWLMTAPFLFIGVLGVVVGCMLLVLSKYVKHAAALKEEADCTL